MQLWFARNAIVPLRDQLATQLMLAIVSGELAPGQRLPSTRTLARRFRLHPNTVSAAYQRLESLQWVESLRGSGVYVREGRREGEKAQNEALDRLVLTFVHTFRSAGLSAEAVRKRLDHWLNRHAKRFVFVHPDEDLRNIICYELRQALAWEVVGCDATATAVSLFQDDTVFLTVPSKVAEVGMLTASGSELVGLQIRQVAPLLSHYLPAQREVLTVVASGWPTFLQVARTMLTAAGYDPESLEFRDTDMDGWWHVGVGSVLVCDTLAATAFPAGITKIVFPLLSDATLTNLKSYERFFGVEGSGAI